MTRGIVDIGLTAVVPAGVAAEHVRNEALVLVGRRGDPLLRWEMVDLASLQREPLITAGLGCDPILNRLFASAGLGRPELLRAQDIATALNMVREGIGVTILPETAVQDRDMRDLRTRPFRPQATRQLYAIARHERSGTGAVPRMIEIVRGRLEGGVGH